MTAIRHLFTKATIQGLLATMLVGTACALALRGDFEKAAAFATLAMVPLGWYYGRQQVGPDK